MKSQVDNLLHIASGIVKDVQMAYPELRGLALDMKRLTLNVKSRGLAYFLLDLPLLDSLLTKGLEQGQLPMSGYTHVSPTCRVPRLFSGLYKLIFNENSLCLRQDADPTAVAFLRQILCVGKKLVVPCSRARIRNAYKEYVDVDKKLPAPTLQWGLDSLGLDSDRNSVHFCNPLVTHLPFFPDSSGESRSIKRLLNRCQQVADIVASEFGIYCPECVVDANQAAARPLGLKHGPGAVAEKRGDGINKFAFTNWSPKLQYLFPIERFGKMPNNDGLVTHRHEAPSRLLAVPKTAKGPRLIAAEPSEHMFCQKLTSSWLKERINRTVSGLFINFRRQELSGEMVLQASLDRSLSTIDLSSASDRLSLWVVERMFRSNPSILAALHAHRTRWTYIAETQEYIELRKFASQGSDVTFPVQSICFLVAALAGCMPTGNITRERIVRLRGKVRVFGDDIIVPQYGYVGTTKLLAALGLKVNEEKSFHFGNFRESCGVDAFMGYDVTPTKPKVVVPDGPESSQAVIDTINNLFYKGYWNASSQLENRLRDSLRTECKLLTKSVGSGATGLVSFSFHTYLQRQVRANPCSGISGINTGFSQSVSSRNERLILESLFRSRIRWNGAYSRWEVYGLRISGTSRLRPYHCGYSGLLHRAISPGSLDLPSGRDGLLGVPARSGLKLRSGWEALDSFI